MFYSSEKATISIQPNKIDNESSNEESESDDVLPDTIAAKKLMKGFCLSIAYAASTGGAGTLVGTAPNLVLKGFVEANYPNSKLSFLTYMAYSLPVAFIMITLSWVSLVLLWLPKK